MNTDGWICSVLDNAGARLLALEEVGLFPTELRVGSGVYDSFVRLRHRELSDGVPLLVLGTAVTEDPQLTADQFLLRP
ncbi:hypothetical protein AB0M86_14665 [Streptomyces sp. NPDC051639]|uniref:hypothetical protein n=1 Tax=unclassified Streptomyces TaxID=2593676 RepID=UPI00143E18CF|nr:hypothetical protein [Streptomyces sp. RPA4-2]QIY61387.1 hypothetical protein HEP85_06535 [Streptomyces sp. RPA4-2]